MNIIKKQILIFTILILSTVGIAFALTSLSCTSTGCYITSMNDLGDVKFTSINDGDIIQYNISSNQWENIPFASVGNYCPTTGCNFTGTIDLNGNKLTEVGQLIMGGVITSQDIIPTTTNLYTLGNSTHKWASAYINNIYSKNINTTNINTNTMNVSTLNNKNGDDIVVIIT